MIKEDINTATNINKMSSIRGIISCFKDNIQIWFNEDTHRFNLSLDETIWKQIANEYGFDINIVMTMVTSELYKKEDIIKVAEMCKLDSFIYKINGKEYTITKKDFADFKLGRLKKIVYINFDEENNNE